MSVMSVSTVTMPRLSSRTRARRLHEQVVAERRGDAHADQPASVARLARAVALRLLQPKRSAPSCADIAIEIGAARTGRSRLLGIDLRVVEDAELDRIDAELLRHLVHGDLERHHAGRLAGRAHGVAFGQVEHREPHRRHAVGAGIQQPRLTDRASRACRPGRSPDQLSCAMAVILPSSSAPMRMRWIVAGRWVVLFIISGRGSATFTGPPRRARAERGQHRIGAQEQLPAEAAADVGRDEAHVLLGDAERLRQVAAPQSIIWFEVQTVSLSPSHAAIDACGSIIACDWSGVV